MIRSRPALLVVDVQRGFDDTAYWGPRNNPDCERNIARLLEHWRLREYPLVLVRHDSNEPNSPLRPGQPGNELQDIVAGEPALTVAKSVNSAFYGSPDLHAWLQGQGIDTVVICGITTNHCCETTARMAGNLGYDVRFVIDATYTFDRNALDGAVIPADDVSRMTAANLDGEFATVCTTEAALRDLAGEA